MAHLVDMPARDAQDKCPVCRHSGCASRRGGTCGPPVERRKAGADRRETERRFFPRPEGRRHGGGRRITDPVD